jgi:ribonuclease VapC
VLLAEEGAAAIARVIEAASRRLMSAANLVEAGIVIESRKGHAGGLELDLLIARAGIEIVSVDQEQAAIARLVWRRFGKGQHQARLNY